LHDLNARQTYNYQFATLKLVASLCFPSSRHRNSAHATETGALFLKRKRGSSTPYRGLGQKDKSVWKHARARLPYEAERDDHGHQIFYCAEDNCSWKGPSSNAARHLRKHAIFVGRFSATPSTIAQANSLQQGLHSMALKHAESSHN